MNQLSRHFLLACKCFHINLHFSVAIFSPTHPTSFLHQTKTNFSGQFIYHAPSSLRGCNRKKLINFCSTISKATMRREKGVWVAVYVEKPRRRSLSNRHQQQHHHHHHLHLHQAKNACNGRGYNRKAQLLEYTRKLRESARSQASSPLLHPEPFTDHDNHRQPMTQMISVQKKRRRAITPTCLGNWKLLIPGVLGSFLMSHNKREKTKKYTNNRSMATKIKAIMRSFQVKRKGGFTSKMFATLRRRR